MDNSCLEVSRASDDDRVRIVLSSTIDKWRQRCDEEKLRDYPIGCLVREKSDNGFLMEGRVIEVKRGLYGYMQIKCLKY